MKMLRKFMTTILLLGSFAFVPEIQYFKPIVPIAYADVHEYTGIGEYIMSDKETPEFATNTAKIYAQRDASEKAGVFISSMTEVKNNIVTKDEIETFSASILKIKGTNVEVIPLTGEASGWIKYRVTVRTIIDENAIGDLISKYMNRRNEKTVAENKSLQKIIDEQRDKVAKFENDLSNKNKNAVESDIKQLENMAVYQKKLSEALSVGASDAIRIYTEAIELNPIGVEAYFRRALKLGGTQKLDDLSRAIAIDPSYTEAYYFRALEYTTIAEEELAIDDYTKVIESGTSKRKIDAYKGRGHSYYELGDYANAIADYTKVLEKRPNEKYVYSGRALAYKNIGDYARAIEDYTKYLQIVNPTNIKNPALSMTYKFRGECYQALGETEKANADFAMAE